MLIKPLINQGYKAPFITLKRLVLTHRQGDPVIPTHRKESQTLSTPLQWINLN